jgi:hypothetical protein
MLRLYPSSDPPSIAAQAPGARAQVERALDRVAWRWSRSLSLLLDGLVILEEQER